MRPLLLALLVLGALPLRAADALASLVSLLGRTGDPQVQLDVLRGLRDATQGRQNLPLPDGWLDVEKRLAASDHAEVRSLARGLGLTFGSAAARDALRALLVDPAADTAQRQEALRALVGARDATLGDTLRELLRDTALRGPALRALAGYENPANGPAILAIYPALGGIEKRDALSTLGSRPAYARELLAAMETGRVSTKDLTAEVLRQLRSLKDPAVDAALTRVYGSFREVDADKQAEIARFTRLYRAGGSTPGEATRGRAAYAKVCQQCHTLFEVGGRVGPDLTGSNRGDLEYILQNIIDPNAVIPNEYRASTLELKDGRILTGIVKQQDDRSVTVATANETLALPRSEITEISQSQLSMMPEGLLAPLAEQEFRDLVYYLGRPGQSPMVATPDTVGLFFDGRDLAMWRGTEGVWRLEAGEIIGSAPNDRAGAKPEFLRSDIIAGDFRLALEFRGPVGIAFRAEPTPDGAIKGYRLGTGGAGWNQLAEIGGRGPLGTAAPTPATPRPADWNHLEIVASGSRLRATLNGSPLLDLDDPAGARRGIVALEYVPAPASVVPAPEARFRNLGLQLVPDSKPQP